MLARDEVREALAEEPGTYFLTDFLVKTFDASVARPLRLPELRDAYFANYTRVALARPGADAGAARSGRARGRDHGPAARDPRGRDGWTGAAARATRRIARTMTDFPSSAKAVVVGAGIVGNSMVHHLARLGWRDLVLLDKGALPNPGGSTGHASNFIFPVDHSKEMTALTRDSTDQYIELGVHTVERRDRGRAHAGAAGGVQPAHHLVDLVGRAVGAAHAGAGEGARAVHQRGDHPRRLPHARRSAASTRSAPAR